MARERRAGRERDGADGPLAAIVRKERGDAAVAALREAGVYDADRRVVEHDDGTIAVPVTEPPEVDVLDVVRQRDPDARVRDLDDLLAERGWTDEELARAPSSWAVVGTVVLVDVPADCPDEADVGEALLELHREADTVLAREGVAGPTREPERRVVAGTGDTETVHTEHGVRYAMDLAEELFSPGNKAERARIGALVAARGRDDGAGPSGDDGGDPAGDDGGERSASAGTRPAVTLDPSEIPDRIPELDSSGGATDGDGAGDAAGDAVVDGAAAGDADVNGEREHVFDMFAGVGYFTLPAAVAGARVTAAEIDPDSFGYLIENAQLNGVGDRVAAYVADCREVADVVSADRVVMGHYDAREYLDAALEAVRDGGVLHYHAVVPEAELEERPRRELATAAEAAGREVDVAAVRRVKSYGEGVWHVVADARVTAADG